MLIINAFSLILPFIFAAFIALFAFIKNPVYIRRIFNTFAFLQLFVSFFALFEKQNSIFSLLGFSFKTDGFCLLFSFLISLIVLVTSIFSKTIVKKLHRLFYSSVALYLGLVNLVLYSDNIFLILTAIFWIFILDYLLNFCFNSKQGKKSYKTILKGNIFVVLVSAFLICFDFARYFIVNDISFGFSSAVNNLYNISDTSVFLAVLGFLIIAIRLLNFIPFNFKTVNNPLINAFSSIMFFITGNYLLIKVYLNFDYILCEIQQYVVIYLIFNILYFLILTYSEKNIFNFLKSATIITAASIIIPLFTFNEINIKALGYNVFAFSISIYLAYLIFIILKEFNKSDNIEDFSKINDKTKLTQFFTCFCLLNLVKIPPFSLFWGNTISLISIFSIDFESFTLTFAPYCLAFASFGVALAFLNMIYKILIESDTKQKNTIQLANHQLVAFVILTLALIIISLYPQYIFDSVNLTYGVGEF